MTDRPGAVLQPPGRSPADNAQLALLLEVAATPKPGNVDRHRDLADLRFEQFLAGAVGAGSGLRRAERGSRVGVAFERAVAGMSGQSGGNTQFGCLLLLTPLVGAAASADGLTTASIETVVGGTTVDDAVDFYRAFEHVDVSVREPPSGAADLDVRHGASAEPALRERGLTLRDVMATGGSPDGAVPDLNALEWTEGFPRTFEAANTILDGDGPLGDRVAHAFLDRLAAEPDTLVAISHGRAVALETSERAAAVRGDLEAAAALAEEFVEEGINPGTTADVVCAGLFVALERGLEV